MTEEEKTTSFAVVLTPEFDDKGKFIGSMGIHMEEEINHSLTDEQTVNLRGICGMLITCVTLMEQDEDFCDYVQNNFATMFAESMEEIIGNEEHPTFTRSEDGKVITLDFETKTHGSA